MNKKNKIKDNSYVNDVVDKLECIAEIAVLSVIYFYSGVFSTMRHCFRRCSTGEDL